MTTIVVKHKPQLGVTISADRLHVVIDTADTVYEYENPANNAESYTSVPVAIEDVPALIEALKDFYEKVKHLPSLSNEQRHAEEL
ncbi:hypothetical protein JHW33_08540 [Rahnella aceris]|uniref:Uncharacterized protein n=1 Tax=Rahnella perminowiae TaxID=2816244 RepID=A0ABS6L6C7_9GAMM|nr:MULTISPECIES: hypothetical protein [Rahnella]MBU9837384.1 hypothetical protein [Rahnella perminowiae]QQN36639.1 hypothetical protein JHW33_08540 [Rahnella aceris]